MHSTGPSQADMEALAAFLAAFGLVILVVSLAVTAFTTICWCLIFRKAGWSWALGLLTLVPIANIVIFVILAFAQWPIQREMQALRFGAGLRTA